MSEEKKPVIGIIGGTGDLGSGLARMWAQAGYLVLVGSREREKAVTAAAGIAGDVRGNDNVSTAQAADIIVITVPFSNHEAILKEIKPFVQGKIVVDAVVPLVPPTVSKVQLPPQGSAALAAQQILGDNVRVVSAFHNISATKLRSGNRAECDVLVFGDEGEAREQVVELAEIVASRAFSGGSLANSTAAEALTCVLIWLNRHYKVRGAGIHITGLEKATADQ